MNNKKAELQATLKSLGHEGNAWPFTSVPRPSLRTPDNVGELRNEASYIPPNVIQEYREPEEIKAISRFTQIVRDMATVAPKMSREEAIASNKTVVATVSAAETLERAKYNNYEAMVSDWFSYHSPTQDKLDRMDRVREGAKTLALTIVSSVPDGADRDAALQLLRQVSMMANSAISME